MPIPEPLVPRPSVHAVPVTVADTISRVLPDTVSRLADQVWAFSALAAATESGVLSALAEPIAAVDLATRTGVPVSMVRGLLDVLAALDLVAWDGDVATPGKELVGIANTRLGLSSLRDDLRRTFGQCSGLIADARSGSLAPGWRHASPDVIRAQGTFARVHTDGLLVRELFPHLRGLGEKLRQPGARALDVGSGAAGNAIGFCRAFPHLSVVGLEPFAPSFAEGRLAVVEAELEDRIELRQERVETLVEESTYDFVWLPQMFLDDATLAQGLETCMRALRPGGWLVSAWICDSTSRGIPAAVARLRDVAFGGEARGRGDIAARLEAAGLEEITSTNPELGVGALAGRRQVD